MLQTNCLKVIGTRQKYAIGPILTHTILLPSVLDSIIILGQSQQAVVLSLNHTLQVKLFIVFTYSVLKVFCEIIHIQQINLISKIKHINEINVCLHVVYLHMQKKTKKIIVRNYLGNFQRFCALLLSTVVNIFFVITLPASLCNTSSIIS